MGRVAGTFTQDGVSPPFTTAGKNLVIIASGDFGGGSLTVEIQLTNGAWQQLGAGNAGSINGAEEFISQVAFPANFNLRARLSGATDPDVKYILQA